MRLDARLPGDGRTHAGIFRIGSRRRRVKLGHAYGVPPRPDQHRKGGRPNRRAALGGLSRPARPGECACRCCPCFVWRLQTDEGNATALRPYDDDRIIVNMSTWESIETLRAFVYS